MVFKRAINVLIRPMKDTCKDFQGFGVVRNRPEFIIPSITQEVGKVSAGSTLPFEMLPMGSRLEILPNHSCLAAACHDSYYCVDSEGAWAGKILESCRGW